MNQLRLVDYEVAPFIVEETAFEGVRKIAHKVMADIQSVCDKAGEIRTALMTDKKGDKQVDRNIVLIGTLGKSELLDQLIAGGKLDEHLLIDKREVYMFKLIEEPFPGINQAVVIAGSDKRGTIYGLFHLSELIGVTPYTYWGDVKARKYREIYLQDETPVGEISEDMLVVSDVDYVSKEPSVKYRGFFINDEWPCFGNWTESHFGGFNAEMYDKVFEFLLRLKGNYLWPAMWSSSFALDGPGLASARLADLYGVIIGNSHHEPCLRAGEEWSKYKGNETVYGTAWDYRTNKEGLIKFWADGLKRSGKFESLITIGMRGERDSCLLEGSASLKDNIDVLKDIVIEQRKLIRQYVNEDVSKVPQLLALYKEVEAYFYGDENVEGLKDWKELEDVIFMLCEDNFGNMRTLPPKENANRKGGWGMYYHFDYHGAPISYEWVNSTRLAKVWEQMTMAYEYGVREAWIVNVGDLKFNEFPLGYFMALAYDFEKWGSDHPNITETYTKQWLKKQFGAFIGEAEIEEIAEVIEEYTYLDSLRRPEALNPHIYHPAHFNEGERMLARAMRLEEKAQNLLEKLPDACKSGYYSMIYYPAAASANLLKMHLASGINQLYAEQGRPLANVWAQEVDECIAKDNQLCQAFEAFLDGKWKGMASAHHIGFTNWNDQDYRYPIKCYIEPAKEPRLVVVKKGETKTHTSAYFKVPLVIDEFLSLGEEKVTLELINGGVGSYEWCMTCKCPWLEFSKTKGNVADEEQISIKVLRDKMPKNNEEVTFSIKAGAEEVLIKVMAKSMDISHIPEGTFMPYKGVVTIGASHYHEKDESTEGKYIELEGYGRSLSAMKAFPVTKKFTLEEAPKLKYVFWVEEAGQYELEVYTAPSNPISPSGNLDFGLQVNKGENQIIHTIPEGYLAGEGSDAIWAQGVLNNIHKTCTQINLPSGCNTMTIAAIDAPLVLDKFLIYKKENMPEPSYLGPMESKQI